MYEAESDAAVLKGLWKDLGVNKDFRGCECPSFYPLPEPTPGFEAEYETLRTGAGLSSGSQRMLEQPLTKSTAACLPNPSTGETGSIALAPAGNDIAGILRRIQHRCQR